MGTVYLVGAGPGAADLLTLRAARLLERADIVFYDALVQPEILALAVGAMKIPVGKRCGRHSTAQRFINKRLIDAAASHATVVRLKGGDPMLFGRAQEEIDALEAAGVPCEIVPGITAALAASADLKIALSQRGSARSVSFVTPRTGDGEPPNSWASALAVADAGVIYMGAGEAASIRAALIAQGRAPDTPVVIVENASMPGRRIIATTLDALPAALASAGAGPMILLLGNHYAKVRSSRIPDPATADELPVQPTRFARKR